MKKIDRAPFKNCIAFMYFVFSFILIIYRLNLLAVSSFRLFFYQHLSFPNPSFRLWSFVTQGLEKKERNERRIRIGRNSIASLRGKMDESREDSTKSIISVKNFWMLCYDDRWKKRLASATSFKARRTRRVTERRVPSSLSVYTRRQRHPLTPIFVSNVRGACVNLLTRVTRVSLYRQFIEPSG